MTSPLPTSVPTDGTMRVDFVPTIADRTAPKAATELGAAGAQELSGYITGDGWAPSGEQATVTDERLASTQTFEQPGRKTKSLTVTYVHNPDDVANNEAYLTLTEGVKGYLVVRWGVPRGTAWAAGDIVDVWPVTAGEPMKNYNGANSVHTATQRLFVTGDVISDAVVVA
ncbi:phage tail tube protein [Micromonospora chersina]|uniref:phage tail tube protein n=1 Tax=Micromonospora chersina TaxID=47854 RepID=UPI00371FE653